MPSTLRDRIVAREPEGWWSFAFLLDYTEGMSAPLARLDGVHLVLDSESLSPTEIADRVRATRPDMLARTPA